MMPYKAANVQDMTADIESNRGKPGVRRWKEL